MAVNTVNSKLALVIAIGSIAGLITGGYLLKKSRQETKEKIVHYITHSHNDMGWLFPASEYYTNMVRPMFNDVITQFEVHNLTFYSVGNIGFIKTWFAEQEDQINVEKFKSLMYNGKIELLNPSVSSPDVACTYFEDLVTNFRYGRWWISKHLPKFPQNLESSWMVDAFGHSVEFARLCVKCGQNNMIINRINGIEKDERRSTSTMELNWTQSFTDKNSGEKSAESIFTHIISPFYIYPQAFFDMEKMPDNIIEGTKICNAAYDQIEGEVNGSVNGLYLLTMGSDFAYQPNSRDIERLGMLKYCENLYKRSLIKRKNRNFKFKAVTLDEYFKLLREKQKNGKKTIDEKLKTHENTNKTKETLIEKISKKENLRYLETEKENKQEIENSAKKLQQYENKDFFPVLEGSREGDFGNGVWVGYYSTKQIFKAQIKRFGQITRMLKEYFCRFGNGFDKSNFEMIKETDFWVGILTHHDAITGTSVNKTDSEYKDTILKHINEQQRSLEALLTEEMKAKRIIENESEIDRFVLGVDLSTDDKRIPLPLTESDKEKPALLLITKSSKKNTYELNFKNSNKNGEFDQFYSLKDTADQNLPGSMVCDPLVKECTLHYDLKLEAQRNAYMLQKSDLEASEMKRIEFTAVKENSYQHKTGGSFGSQINASITNGSLLIEGATKSLIISFMNYNTKNDQDQGPGVYLMSIGKRGEVLPVKVELKNLAIATVGKTTLLRAYIEKSRVYVELKLLSKYDEPQIDVQVRSEFETLESGLNNKRQAEYFIRYKFLGVKPRNHFYSDANGMSLIKRTMETRPELQYFGTYIESYIYPANSIVCSSDDNLSYGVRIDRSTSVSSYEDGAFDIWIKRMGLDQDQKGNPENLFEGGVVTQKHTVFWQETSKVGEDWLEETQISYKLIQRMRRDQIENERVPIVQSIVLNKEPPIEIWKKMEEEGKDLELPDMVKLSVDSGFSENEVVLTFINFDQFATHTVPDLSLVINWATSGKQIPVSVTETSIDLHRDVKELHNINEEVKLTPMGYRTFKLIF